MNPRFDRQCWLLDENAAASWAAPGVGQHELYIPSYFETENNVSSRNLVLDMRKCDFSRNDYSLMFVT